MEIFIKFFRDTLSGWPYIITVMICLFFIFAIIGYLCNEKYNSEKKKI